MMAVVVRSVTLGASRLILLMLAILTAAVALASCGSIFVDQLEKAVDRFPQRTTIDNTIAVGRIAVICLSATVALGLSACGLKYAFHPPARRLPYVLLFAALPLTVTLCLFFFLLLVLS